MYICIHVCINQFASIATFMTMLQYIMLCYVMLCYVMLCYVMLCYVMLCYVMLCYTTSKVGKVLNWGQVREATDLH